MHFSPEPVVDTRLNLGINYNPQGPLSNLGEQLGREAAISFAPPPIVSQADQDKQKYYSTLIQAGVDPSMARQIAGVAAPVKGYLDVIKGDEPILKYKGGNLYTDVPNTSIWYDMPMNFGGR